MTTNTVKDFKKMGNAVQKEGGSNIDKYQHQWEEDYKRCIESASISGSTWEEFEQRLTKHIENSHQIEKEWEVITFEYRLFRWSYFNSLKSQTTQGQVLISHISFYNKKTQL